MPWVRWLGQEDPLEEGTATHSSILAWRIPWAEEAGRLSPWGCQESDTTEATKHAQKDRMIREFFFQLLGGLRKWKPRCWINDNENTFKCFAEHQGTYSAGVGPRFDDIWLRPWPTQVGWGCTKLGPQIGRAHV